MRKIILQLTAADAALLIRVADLLGEQPHLAGVDDTVALSDLAQTLAACQGIAERADADLVIGEDA